MRSCVEIPQIFVLSLLCTAFCTRLARASSAAGTETLIGIQGPDYVVLGADSSVSQSIALTASNLDKIAVLVDPFPSSDDTDLQARDNVESITRQHCIVAAAAGDAADSDRLIGMLAAHAVIREFEASVGCDVELIHCGSESSGSSSSNPSRPSTVLGAAAGLTVQDVAYVARHQIASRLRSGSPLNVCLLLAGMMPVLPRGEPSSMPRRARERQDQRLPRILLASSSMSDASRERLSRGQGRTRSSLDLEATSEPLQDSVSASRSQDNGETISRLTVNLEPRLFWLDEYGSIQRLSYGAHGFGSNFILSILDRGYRSTLSQAEAIQLIRSCFEQLRIRYVINSPQAPCIKCIDRRGCRLVVE
jgi:20S proteasome alpha/beta subunit